jgi:hypothetical protein
VKEPKAVVKQMHDLKQRPPWNVPEAFTCDFVRSPGIVHFSFWKSSFFRVSLQNISMIQSTADLHTGLPVSFPSVFLCLKSPSELRSPLFMSKNVTVQVKIL